MYFSASANKILIFMDEKQTNHLKAYGVAYIAIQAGITSDWLLNYRGGSFLIDYNKQIATDCRKKNVSFELISDAAANNILDEISSPEINMDRVPLEKAPKVAVYAPDSYKPWDDAVMLVLTYAEIPFDMVYDQELLDGKLDDYDWLHVHHEDFTGQYGKFYSSYKNAPWYKEQVREFEQMAQKNGFSKVSKLKLEVAKTIKNFVFNGGFMFAMCSATDSYDIALAAQNTDICGPMCDGDPINPNCQKELDYSQCFAFKDFKLITDPNIYEYSDIDVTRTRSVTKNDDVFTLFEFSAKWDPVPTILCQNHVNVINGFYGQTTAFDKNLLKSNVIILGENKALNEARYIHGEYGKGTFTFYGGHDPEDYMHYVGDEYTNLENHPNSPGYRLILNNLLFPAAKKKQQKT